MSTSALGEAVVNTMRQHLGLSIGVVAVTRPGQDRAWRIDASDASGERWAAEHEDYYTAACMLAELVGFELEDG